jgi:hypothetical protein
MAFAGIGLGAVAEAERQGMRNDGCFDFPNIWIAGIEGGAQAVVVGATLKGVAMALGAVAGDSETAAASRPLRVREGPP